MSLKLQQLRGLLKTHKIQAYLINAEDQHQSEYIANVDARREFISAFSGSAGWAVVTETKAALWTDGRYYLQASNQLDQNWLLMKAGLKSTPTREEWLNSELQPNSRVGLDPKLISVSGARLLVTGLSTHEIVSIKENLVDQIWNEQPLRPSNQVEILDEKYSGQNFHEKLSQLRSTFKSDHWGFLVGSLDEIAWLFNLRGSDITFNPVFFAYALITREKAVLYIDKTKLNEAALRHLQPNIEILPYDQVFEDLKVNYAANSLSQKLLIDGKCNLAIQEAIGGPKAVHELKTSPITTLKAIKNETELQGFRDCHIRDASALCEYFSWLEEQLHNKATITEFTAAEQLEKFRSTLPNFKGLSFDTISSSGANGAIIHYKPQKDTCAVIDPNQIYLCDSGAQFLDGTTDVTRTMHFGSPSLHEKECFTRVLKGHIQIDNSKFPNGTTGFVLDVLARTSLWEAGLDFQHGTGHGVGSYLNVHEGPHGIGIKIVYNDFPLLPGMTVTNEPGFYEDGKFGLRIENVLLIKESKRKFNFGGVGFLEFEHVTVVPIQTKMIEKALLSRKEIDWVNAYNQECFEKVSPLLGVGSRALKWLERETAKF